MADQAAVPALPLARAGAFLTRRAGRLQLAAVALVLVFIGGAGFNYWASQHYGAAGTATAYVDALSRGDDATAWQLTSLGLPGASKVDATLLDQKALHAQLATAANRPPANWSVGQQQAMGDAGMSIILSHGPTSATVLLVADGGKHFGIYPAWRVYVKPVVLQLSGVTAGPAIAVDGIILPKSSTSVAVFPGRHLVTTSASSAFDATNQPVQAVNGTGDPVKVAISPQLSIGGRQAAAKAVSDALAACSVSGWLPYACPVLRGASGDSYEVVGDPTSQLSYRIQSNGQVIASGLYQAIMNVKPFSGPLYHRFYGGPFEAVLALGDGSASVDHFNDIDKGAPFAAPAGVSNDQILAAVSKQLDGCVATTQLSPPDCPNSYDFALGQMSGVHWSYNGSPMTGAAVTFDPKMGAYNVSGQFSTHLQFVWNYGGIASNEAYTIAGSYLATVIIDKGSPRLVTIQRV